ncbi:MAG: hypothetical protein V4665_03945 [Patescibacteria group bacterium]
MDQKVINVYKKSGQTPLECIQKLKNAHLELRHVPLSYAGRLDPLAEGVLLILVGDECLKKDDYLALDKEYEMTILFGFSTDTYDVMGLVDESKESQDLIEDISDKVSHILPQFVGRISQKYPAYSSRTVDSKPLFQWAREGKLDEIVIPSHDVFIKSINIVSSGSVSSEEFRKKIHEMITAVHGDFRQDQILGIWNKILRPLPEKEFPVLTLRIVSGSGVYVRALAHDIGQALGIPALALGIVRTRVGDYRNPEYQQEMI